VLPFAASLAAGLLLAAAFDGGLKLDRAPTAAGLPEARTHAPAARTMTTTTPSAGRESPSVHVLSPMLMSEVMVMERIGEYEAARILSPPGVAYVPAQPREYRQGVLQVNFLFGMDGKISGVVPVERRVMCGPCLEGDKWVRGEKVVSIERGHPRFAEFLEAAAAALGRIEFVPAKVAGTPYPTNGFAECVFRLD
jgi:hypothetical protein